MPATGRSEGATFFVFVAPAMANVLAWVALRSQGDMVFPALLASVLVSFVALVAAVAHAIGRKDGVFLPGALWAAGGIALTILLVFGTLSSGGSWC